MKKMKVFFALLLAFMFSTLFLPYTSNGNESLFGREFPLAIISAFVAFVNVVFVFFTVSKYMSFLVGLLSLSNVFFSIFIIVSVSIYTQTETRQDLNIDLGLLCNLAITILLASLTAHFTIRNLRQKSND
jgi:hypothetical protein